MRRYIKNANLNKKQEVGFLLISLLILTLAMGYFTLDKNEDKIVQIIALADKNELSHANGVWISNIKSDNENIDLSELELSNSNWVMEDGCLYTLHIKNDEPIDIKLDATNNIEITFHQNDWCGKAKIMCDDFVEELDFYSDIATFKTVDIAINNQKEISIVDVCILLLIFVFMYISVHIVYICTKGEIMSKIRRIFVCEFAFLYLAFYELCDYFKTDTIIILAVLIFLANYYYGTIKKDERLTIYLKAKGNILLILSAIYTAFAFVGNPLFIDNKNITIHTFMVLVLATILTYPIILFVVYGIYKISSSSLIYSMKKKNTLSFKIQCFLVMFIPLLIISLGYYPGNMTGDGASQYMMALGRMPLLNNHPAIHTLFLRLCYYIYPSIYTVVVVHILLFSLIWTAFLSYLYERNIKKSILIAIAFIIACCPNNYMQLSFVQKNAPYTIIILWIMFLIIEMIWDSDSFFAKKRNFVKYTIALTLLYTVRHNGFLPTYAMIIFLILWGIQKKKYLKNTLLIVCATILMIYVVTGPFYQAMGVVKTATSVRNPLIAPAGMFIISDEEIPDNVDYIVEEIGTKEQWEEFYNPYNGDKLSWSTLRENIRKCSTKEAFKLYISLLKSNPWLVIKDRLMAIDLLWNVIEPTKSYQQFGAYCGRYVVGIWAGELGPKLPELISQDTYVDNGHYYRANMLSKFGKIGNELVTSLQFLDTVVYRNGIYIIMMMILGIYNVMEKKGKKNLILIPPLITLCSLALAASWQAYQYYWFFSQAIFMFLLYTCFDNKSKYIEDNKEKNKSENTIFKSAI